MIPSVNKNRLYHFAVIVCLLYFLVKCIYIGYTVKTGVPPDEWAHIELIKYYANHNLFRIDPGAFGPSQVAGMAPDNFLYHLLLGKLSAPFKSSGQFIFILRLFNILLALINVYVFLRLANLIFSERIKVLFSLILYTNVLMFTFLSSSISYDNLLNLMAVLSIYLLVRIFQEFKLSHLFYFIAISFLGLLIKPSLLPISVLIFPLFLYIFFKNERFREKIKEKTLFKKLPRIPLIFAMGAFVVSGYVLVNNQRTYGKTININCHQIFGGDTCVKNSALSQWYKELQQKHLGEERESLLDYYDSWIDLMIDRTFGIAAHQSMTMSSRQKDAVKILLIIGFILFLRKPKSPSILITATIFGFYVLVLLVYQNYRSYIGSGELGAGLQGRYIFPVLSCLTILLVEGFTGLHKMKMIRNIGMGLITLFFISLDFPSYMANSSIALFEKEKFTEPFKNDELVYSEEKGTKIQIDYYNEILIQNKDELIDLAKVNDELVLKGWAFDTNLNVPAKYLIFQVNDREIRFSNYGLNRPDVGQAFRNKNLSAVGFEMHIPFIDFNKEINELKIILVNQNEEAYTDYRKINIVKKN